MKICIKRIISITYLLIVLTINYVSVHDMTIQDKLLQRQEEVWNRFVRNWAV